ncbi:MAG: argininosuccinate synthase [Candidatus Sumerlaeia bacterium]|nr:argininosuccinate synthase [Candidatus Sumerlaeia bacterium]
MSTTVLAYSGGLDTSVILHHLVQEGHTVHAVYANLGQPGEDMDAVKKKALQCGAKSFHNIDCREELCADFAFPVLQWQAKYEGNYLLGTSIARPVIAKACVQVARDTKADTYSHGATGKGNDQCRFQLAANALEPKLRIHALWRDEAFRKKFPGRLEMIEYARKHGIPVKATKKAPYSSDENLLHISYEAGILEDLTVDGVSIVDFGMTVAPEKAPAKGENVTIGFKDGVPESVNGKKLSPAKLVETLNQIGGRHGVGRIDMVEGRFVGMKSRGVYEAPGMTLLYAAHRALEQITMDRDLMHLRDRLAPEVAELVYYGFWYSRKMDSLLAFIRDAQKNVTGEVALRLYKGNVNIASRKSPFSLYDMNIATMEAGGDFNQTDSEGFLRIQGLPIRVEAKHAGWSKALRKSKKG